LRYVSLLPGLWKIEDAIAEEKRLKGGSRKQKDDLIMTINPGWVDMWNDVCGGRIMWGCFVPRSDGLFLLIVVYQRS
jgi:hypothetical protein